MSGIDSELQQQLASNISLLSLARQACWERRRCSGATPLRRVDRALFDLAGSDHPAVAAGYTRVQSTDGCLAAAHLLFDAAAGCSLVKCMCAPAPVCWMLTKSRQAGTPELSVHAPCQSVRSVGS